MPTEYNKFVADHRKAGKSLKEIGAMWQANKVTLQEQKQLTVANNPKVAQPAVVAAVKRARKPRKIAVAQGDRVKPVSPMDDVKIVIKNQAQSALPPGNAPTQHNDPKQQPEPKMRKVVLKGKKSRRSAVGGMIDNQQQPLIT